MAAMGFVSMESFGHSCGPSQTRQQQQQQQQQQLLLLLLLPTLITYVGRVRRFLFYEANQVRLAVADKLGLVLRQVQVLPHATLKPPYLTRRLDP